jgi:hypothetical protein
MFFTPPRLECIAASKDGQLCLLLEWTASSSASCNFRACNTGLKFKLPSGVVGAVEISTILSSESTFDAGMDGCLVAYIVADCTVQEIGQRQEKRQVHEPVK